MLLFVRQPGARVDKYPVELEGFDIWCASTSHFLNERKQTIDLIQNGFSAMYLDDVRPAIKIYEWFVYICCLLLRLLCWIRQRVFLPRRVFLS